MYLESGKAQAEEGGDDNPLSSLRVSEISSLAPVSLVVDSLFSIGGVGFSSIHPSWDSEE